MNARDYISVAVRQRSLYHAFESDAWYNGIIEIKDLIINARNKVAQQVNETLVNTYWNIGKIIVEKE